MGIRAAMSALATLQATLSITSPVTASIKRAYALPPDRASALPDTPCWVNGWTRTAGFARSFDHLADESRSLRPYTAQMQLFVRDANLDRGADIAAAFMEALETALPINAAWNAAVLDWELRGGDPTLALLEWAGQPFAGLNLFCDVVLP